MSGDAKKYSPTETRVHGRTRSLAFTVRFEVRRDPQVDKSTVPSNPCGCWDWWGYTGGDYAKKTVLQMRAIMAIVSRLVQRP